MLYVTAIKLEEIYSYFFTSQQSIWKQDTRLALRHNYQAGSTVLVTSHLIATPPFEEGPFGLYQAYLESAQTLHEIEAWSTHQQPIHPC